MLRALVPNVETLGYYRMSLRYKDLARFRGYSLGSNPSGIGQECPRSSANPQLVSSPAAIRASIPEQGRVLTFKRAVVVDTWADLKIRLEATAAKAASWGVRVLILAASLLILGCFAWAARSFRPAQSQSRP